MIDFLFPEDNVKFLGVVIMLSGGMIGMWAITFYLAERHRMKDQRKNQK